MDIGGINPVDLSAEAALELEEFRQGERPDVPALGSLFAFLRTPGPAFTGDGVSMLADVRSYALLRDSLGAVPKKSTSFDEFRKLADEYFKDLEAGVAARNKERIEEAKRFCLAFSANLVAKQMTEIYARRERADSRYVSHESIP
jgi:hypothetical protein